MNPIRSRAGEFAWGTALAAVFLCLSFALARYGFGNDYYFAILIPIAMIGCLLVAWSLYLKDDGFIKKQAASGESAGLTVPGAGESATISDMRTADKADFNDKTFTENASARPDVSMFAPRDNTLVSRAGSGAAHQGAAFRNPTAPGKSTRRILLWAAAELALAAGLLYALAGVGAKFFG